jgi:Carboxypeptidase regulatory-like domain
LRRLAIALALVALARSLLPAQAPAPASIRGILVRWGTAEPVEQATVELRSASNPNAAPVAITATQGTGEFVFPNVAPGVYRIVAMADGFAASEYGQLRPSGPGKNLIVTAGQQARVNVSITPGGVISGRITDESGKPMVYSGVQVMKLAYDAEGQLAPTVALTVLTNDLGEYRAFWLPPGQYLVNGGSSRLNLSGTQGIIDPRGSDTTIPTTMVIPSMRPRASPPPADEPSPETRLSSVSSLYYPKSSDVRGAEVIELRAGAEVSNIDIRLAPSALPANPVSLRGVVIEPSGQPAQTFGVSISTWPLPTPTPFASVRLVTTRVPATDPARSAPGAQTYVVDNGKFDGAAIPGVYQIRASRGELSGRILIDVGSRDLDVTVPLRAPTSVSGRVAIEGGAVNASANLSGLRVTLRTAPNIQFSGDVAADGQFRIDGVIPGDYQVYVPPLIPAPAAAAPPGARGAAANPTRTAESAALSSALQNAYVKSIHAGSTDLTDSLLRVEGTEPVEPLSIAINLSAASIEGRVLNARQEPVSQATVVILPPGQPPFRTDRYAVSTTGESGQFQFHGLPPGDYRVFAWEDVDLGAWFNPSFLAAYDRYATGLRLDEKERRGLEISAIPASSR